MCSPLANMTFRRKVGATFILFIFISSWFLYFNYILPVITSGGSQGEGIERLWSLYIIVLSCIARSSVVFLEFWLNFRLKTSITLSWCLPLI